MSERQGRELDVFLAEHACGMRFISKQYSFSEWRGLPLGVEPMKFDLRDNYVPVPHYSTNDTDSLQLLDAMRDGGWRWILEDDPSVPVGYYCLFWRAVGGTREYEAGGSSLAAAISRAAEQALEGESKP